MGPEATILLMQKVLGATKARGLTDHVPLIVHQNPQVPCRMTALLESGSEDPMPVLMNMAQDLERAGAQALVMPSSTAHHYAMAVSHATTLPFLNMVDVTTRHLADTGARKIGMLASRATHLSGVYDMAFKAHGLTPVWPGNIAKLQKIIEAAVTHAGKPGPGAHLAAEAESLIKAGADHLLLASADLSSWAGALPPTVPYTDSLDCLCQAIVSYAQS
jgi:aspartate racemase